MFGLWNELFGFPIDNCSYESIECNKTYIPLLNWDKDNEYMWTLVEPYGEGSLDAANITFNTKNIQNWPAEVTRVDEALNHLAQAVKDSYSTLQSFEFALDEDGESLKGTITYLDDKGDEYSKEATINLKDIIEGFDELNLKNVKAESLEVSGPATFKGETTFEGDMEFEGDLTIDGKLTAEDSEIKNLTVTEKLTSTGDTEVNTIESNGKATLDSLEVTNDSLLNGNLEVKENTTLDKDLLVKGISLFKHKVTTEDDLDVGGILHVYGTGVIDHTLTVKEDLEVNGTANARNINTRNITINGALTLGPNASAEDFILKSEKGQPYGVCPLNGQGKVDEQYLPAYIPNCTIHVGYGQFDGNGVCVISDALVKTNSYVNISNYQDIIGDLTEIVGDGEIRITSNFEHEAGSIRYFCATPLSD